MIALPLLLKSVLSPLANLLTKNSINVYAMTDEDLYEGAAQENALGNYNNKFSRELWHRCVNGRDA